MPCHRPREFAARLTPRTESTPLARTILRAYLAGMPQGQRFSDVGELILGELFANAVRHGDAPPDRLIEIRFAVTAGRLRIEVHDAGTGRPTLRPPASPDDEHGRGLFLVNELAEHWGCRPRTGGIGKFVWALIAPAPDFTDLTLDSTPKLVPA
ncbi:ATP-binding protein [Kitasatospora sp. NPDC057500]|uniref:ATP-binding protein n=1 Tax=Kitasatospora sp. NPDC057500 TaxID=3346151 RepID=UPI0036A38BCD